MAILRDYLLWKDFQLYVMNTTHENNCRPHHHRDFFELVFVRAGRAVHILENNEMPIEAGDIFLVHPGMNHSYRNFKPITIYNILFSKAFLKHFQSELSGLQNFQIFFNMHRQVEPFPGSPRLEVMHLDKQYFPEIIHCLEDIIREEHSNASAARIAIMSDFLRLLLLICRHCRPHSEELQVSHAYKISYLMAQLDKRYKEEWSLERMAESVRLSVSSFRQQFKLLTGDSPVKYLLRVRLRKSAALLLMREDSIGEIALECGFSDSNYFSRQFRLEFKMSPRFYRLRNRVE